MAKQAKLPATIHMRLFSPERDALRLYCIREQLSLFGPPELLVEWGALGWKRLHLRVERFHSLDQLESRKAALVARRRRHGYRFVSQGDGSP